MGKLSELPKFSCSSIYLTSLELEYCDHFFTLSTNNEHNQKKGWRINFNDHRHCASRSHNETELKRSGITATTAIGWGQEERMDEDTAM